MTKGLGAALVTMTSINGAATVDWSCNGAATGGLELLLGSMVQPDPASLHSFGTALREVDGARMALLNIKRPFLWWR